MNFLKRLQSKPSGVKTQYALTIASLVTFVIAAVWASTIPARFSNIKTTNVATQEEGSDIGSLFDTSKAQLGNVIDSVKDVPDVLNQGVVEDTTEQNSAYTSLDDLDINAVPQTVNDDAVLPNDDVSNSTSTPIVSEEAMATTTPSDSQTPKVILIGTSTSQVSP